MLKIFEKVSDVHVSRLDTVGKDQSQMMFNNNKYTTVDLYRKQMLCGREKKGDLIYKKFLFLNIEGKNLL